MHGAAITALTLYDMLKPIDKGIEISSIKLDSKTGGKSDAKINSEMPLNCAVIVCSDTISAGQNVNIRSGKRLVVQSNQVDCVAKTGNLAPKGTSSGERIYGPECKNGVDSVETAFNAGPEFDPNRPPFDLKDLLNLFR